jgi:hypothetical protein
VARRFTSLLVTAVVGVGLSLVAAPTAGAALTDTFHFAHDDTLETQSDLFSVGPYDPGAQPDDQLLGFPQFLDENDSNDNYTVPPVEELRETFEFEVAPDEENGSFTAQLNWANPTIDLDMYIYRRRPNGTLDPSPVAQSATGNDEETATYVSPTIDSPVEPGTYVIYVDNWCSSEDDPTVDETLEFLGADPSESFCGVEDPGIDEDDFSGKVEFAPLVKLNKLPSAKISGPGEAKAGDRVTFTGSGTDSDGQIVRYTFDLDGDGNFEYDNAKNTSVTKLYDQPGDYNVGLRVIDDRGGVGYDSLMLHVSGPAVQPPPGATKPVLADELLYSFKLSGPVFGGTKRVPLVVRYRVRKRSQVTLALYRGTGKHIRRVKTLSTGVRRAGKPYRVKVRARGRTRGLYTVRLLVRAADGSGRRVYKLIARRL